MINRLLKHAKGSGLRAQLLRGGAGSISVKLASVLLGFVLTIILARALGPEKYGVYGFTLTLITLIAIPAQVGLPNLVVRETAKASATHDWAVMKGIWYWATRYVVITSLALLVIMGAGLYFAGHYISGQRYEALIVALPLIPLIALGNIRGAALRGLRRVVLGQLPEKVIRTVVLIFLVAMVLSFSTWLELVFTASTALCLYLAAAATAFIVGSFLLWRARPEGVVSEPTIRIEAREWRRAVLPLALIAGVQVLNSNVDILFLGLLRSDEEVGLYRVVIQLGNLVVFGLTAINMVLHPYISRLHQQGNREALQRLTTTSARVILLLALPPVILFVFFGEWALTLAFGAEYKPAYVALALLSLGQLVNAGMGSVGALLNMSGHERDTMRGMLIAIVLNIMLNLLLIPPFGIEGAALATALTFAIWNVLLWRAVWKRLGIKSTALQVTRK